MVWSDLVLIDHAPTVTSLLHLALNLWSILREPSQAIPWPCPLAVSLGCDSEDSVITGWAGQRLSRVSLVE